MEIKHNKLLAKLELCESLGIEIPDEMFDFLDILIPGAAKHGPNNWLEKDGKKSSHKDMYASIGRHIAEAMCKTGPDHESGKDPRLHAITRLNMDYVRDLRGLNDE